MSDLSPAMQRLLDEITELYDSTGRPVAVSRKNRTVQALIKREELDVVTEEGEGEDVYVRPANSVSVETGDHKALRNLVASVRRVLRGNKHRSKIKNRRSS